MQHDPISLLLGIIIIFSPVFLYLRMDAHVSFSTICGIVPSLSRVGILYLGKVLYTFVCLLSSSVALGVFVNAGIIGKYEVSYMTETEVYTFLAIGFVSAYFLFLAQTSGFITYLHSKMGTKNKWDDWQCSLGTFCSDLVKEGLYGSQRNAQDTEAHKTKVHVLFRAVAHPPLEVLYRYLAIPLFFVTSGH